MRGGVWTLMAALAAALVVLGSGAAAEARQAEGFGGLPFGSERAKLGSFMTLKTVGDVEYAVNLNERYRINGQAPAVFYGFAGGRLFAAYVRLDGLVSRDEMARRLSADFGKPAVAVENGVEVLRWRRGDLKVKLKYDPAAGTLKLGYYSLVYGGPAAKALADPESAHFDEISKAYEKNKTAKGVTLPKAPSVKGYSPYDDGVSDPAGSFSRQ
ncbi:hypothetical protein DFW101_2142 [Solidesulfovibrio carbinoliphilus subsp. oakridgensis]|uniref:Uncharacterized protein n=1 Tax=Solidesulfovibrio carbinoliphilus subsp. oakridgensis TaxID=694327 RepID=G7Q9A5_9BACT|nr:hypothetical protein [Solidesulfovibrio carbinoliphilus]EHJ48148.1 hypothetical protein DFW101_2142 [Solidesulfovibrio carbinoliphilus subsp. oakridgensis]